MSPLRVSLMRTANYCVVVVFLLESLFVDLNGCILFFNRDISYFIAVTTVTLGIAINLLLLVHDRKLWLIYTTFISVYALLAWGLFFEFFALLSTVVDQLLD